MNWLIFSLVQQPSSLGIAAGHISISCKGNEIYFRKAVICFLQNAQHQKSYLLIQTTARLSMFFSFLLPLKLP